MLLGIAAGALVCWLALGLVAMGARIPDWRAGSALARAVEAEVAAALVARPETARVVVAGVPDGVGTGLWPAYAFNNGLTEAVRFRLRARGLDWRGLAEPWAGPARPWPLAYTAAGGPALPVEALDAAARETGTLVFAYDPATRRVRRWRKSPE